MRRTRRSRAVWAQIIAEHERSGQTATDFAAAHDLNITTLLRWRGRLARNGRKAAEPEPRLLRVDVKDRPPQALAIPSPRMVRVRVGPTHLQFCAGMDVHYIVQLVRALEAAC